MEIEHVQENKNQKYKDRLLRVKNSSDIQNTTLHGKEFRSKII